MVECSQDSSSRVVQKCYTFDVLRNFDDVSRRNGPAELARSPVECSAIYGINQLNCDVSVFSVGGCDVEDNLLVQLDVDCGRCADDRC